MSIKLVLLRHGQSVWNLENRFTGWHDVDLTEKGVLEGQQAGKLLKEEGFYFDMAFSSMQIRAIKTLNIALEEMGQLWIPITRDWHLNERHYGALQGLNKSETTDQHGEDQVFQWRRSYDVPPPALSADDPRHPRHDPRYADVPAESLPSTECLKDVVERLVPYYTEHIEPHLRAGKRLVIAAHGNSLRALVKHLSGISDEEISKFNIPTGIPLVYELDEELRAIGHTYLGDPEAARKAAHAVANQARQ